MKRNQYTAICLTLVCITGVFVGKAQAQPPNLTECDEYGNPVSNPTNGFLTHYLLDSWSTNTYPAGSAQAGQNIGAGAPFIPADGLSYLYGNNIGNAVALNAIGPGYGNVFSIPGSNPPICFYGTEKNHTSVDEVIYYKWTGPLRAPKSIPFIITENASLNVNHLGFGDNYTGFHTLEDIPGVSGSAEIDNSLGDGDSNSTMGTGLPLSYRYLVNITGDSRNIYEIHISATAVSIASNYALGQSSDPAVKTYGSGMASTGVNETTSAVIDNRKVAISYGPTWHKAKIEDRVGHPVYRDQYGNDAVEGIINLTDPDGTGHGDIGVDDSESGSFKSVDVTYNANRGEGWHINGDTDHWHHNLLHGNLGNDDEDLYDTLTSSSPNISPFIVKYNGQRDTTSPPDPQDAGEQSTIGTDHIHFTYTDGYDGMTSTANFYMNIHRGAEILNSKQTQPEFIERPVTDVEIDNPGYALSNGGIVECTWNSPGVLWEYGSNAFSVLSNAPWPGEGSWVGAALAFAGIGYDKIKPQAAHGGMVFTDEVWDKAPDSAFPPDHPRTPNSDKSNYHMIPHLLAKYAPTYELVDHYGPEGFIFESSAAPAVLQGDSTWVPQFVYYPVH